ncbi:hypothetical protein WP50_18020, partial [Lactiplantibacillus plantarum]
MAYLAVIGSHSVNGVAPLHTELLKTDVLRGLYQVYPERFNNKTNGIATRRWVQLANQPLQVMSYTNHTILQEALETWPIDMFKNLLPRIYQIIAEIDRRYREQQTPIFGKALVDQTAPLGNGQVRMAYLAVIGSH